MPMTLTKKIACISLYIMRHIHKKEQELGSLFFSIATLLLEVCETRGVQIPLYYYCHVISGQIFWMMFSASKE